MSEILKEIFAYFIFLFFLLVVAYGNRDSKAYLMSKNLQDIFVDVDQTGVDLADVSINYISLCDFLCVIVRMLDEPDVCEHESECASHCYPKGYSDFK